MPFCTDDWRVTAACIDWESREGAEKEKKGKKIDVLAFKIRQRRMRMR